MKPLRFFLLTTSVLAAAFLRATVVLAETVDCTPVTSLPATISTQGIFCLTGNLATNIASGNAITITANNVTLDLNGWKVGGQAAGTATLATGIYTTAANVTIVNGIVRGFGTGIYRGGRGAVLRDMLIDQNINLGIYINGEGALIEHNRVVDTGGSAGTNVNVAGIFADSGSIGARISNNMISGLTSSGSGSEWGIIANGPNATLRDNVLSDSARPTGGGNSLGINPSKSSAVVNNIVSNFDVGIYTTGGGIYAHNTAYNCTTSYQGGTAGAGNSP
jgi:hypothetical protein